MTNSHGASDESFEAASVDVARLLAENASLRDRLLRALADAENTRRRAERATADERQFAIAKFALEMLTVADDLQRTLDAAGERASPAPANQPLIEGVRATLSNLLQTLERFGVRRIEALGQRFDPYRHEAVMEADDPSKPPGAVVNVMQDGYMIGDRLLRPARVIVSRRSPPSANRWDNETFPTRGY